MTEIDTPANRKLISQVANELKLQSQDLAKFRDQGRVDTVAFGPLQQRNNDAFTSLAVLAEKAGNIWAAPPVPLPVPPPIPPPSSAFEFMGVATPVPVPTLPFYDVPTEAADCHYITGSAVNSGGNTIAGLYDRARADGVEGTVTIGVHGNGGKVWPGGQYSAINDYSISGKDIDIEIVGLSPGATVEVGWSSRFGNVKRIGLFNIGLRGPDDSFIIRANEKVGTVILHDCRWASAQGKPGDYTSGLHIDNYNTLIINGFRNNPNVKLREHDFYIKSCIGNQANVNTGTWIVKSELKSGNRTGFQRRPQKFDDVTKVTPENAVPQGPFVVAFNDFNNLGWQHPTASGGGAATVWTAPFDSVYIFDNYGTNLRYSGIVCEPQPTWKNFLGLNDFPLEDVYVWGNKMDNPAAGRALMKFSGIERLHLYDNAGTYGSLVFDSGWSSQMSGIVNGKVFAYGFDAMSWIKSMTVKTAKGGSNTSDKVVGNDWIDNYVTKEVSL